MATYVVGDIHGCFNEWIELKNRIEEKDTDAKFILVGDIIDRGDQVVEMLDWAIANITQDGKYQMIMGNHEEEKIDWWNEAIKKCDIQEELNDTTEQLMESDIEVDRYHFAVPFMHAQRGLLSIKNGIEFFKTLPYYKDININGQRFIIVHANIPYEAIEEDGVTLKTELTESMKSFMVWNRDNGDFTKIKDAILIHGHTPTINMDIFAMYEIRKGMRLGKIRAQEHRYNIDCGLVYKSDENSNLGVLNLDTLEEIYLYDEEHPKPALTVNMLTMEEIESLIGALDDFENDEDDLDIDGETDDDNEVIDF